MTRSLELISLMDAICEGRASAEQHDRLHAIMQSDEQARQTYMDYMSLHAELFWRMREEPVTVYRDMVDSSPIPEVAATRTVHRSHWWVGPMSIAAAVLIVGALVTIWLSSTVDRNHPPIAEQRVGDIVGVVVSGDNVVWQGGDKEKPVSAGGPIRAGMIVLENGELELFNGVNLVFSGRVQMELLDLHHVVLHRGRMIATVPHGAEGFTVDAAGVQVVDLGTSFDISVDSSGIVDLRVIAGLVQASMPAPDHDEPFIIRVARDERIRLSAVSGTLSRFDPVTEQFAQPHPADYQERLAGEVVNFRGVTLSPYGNQDGLEGSPSVATVSEFGRTLQLSGNSWKSVAMSYTITPKTVIELDFRSTDSGEMCGIAMDDDDVIGPGRRLILLAGTDIHHQAVINQRLNLPGRWTHCRIPIGEFYTGKMSKIVFFADDDATAEADAWFRNVRVYELENE